MKIFTTKTVVLNTTKPNFHKDWWKDFCKNSHQFLWQSGFVVCNTTVFVVFYTTKQNLHTNRWNFPGKWYFPFPKNLKRIPRKFQNFGLMLEFDEQAFSAKIKIEWSVITQRSGSLLVLSALQIVPFPDEAHYPNASKFWWTFLEYPNQNWYPEKMSSVRHIILNFWKWTTPGIAHNSGIIGCWHLHG